MDLPKTEVFHGFMLLTIKPIRVICIHFPSNFSIQIANQVAESSTKLLCQLVLFWGPNEKCPYIQSKKKSCKSETIVLESSKIITVSLFIMNLTVILQNIYS